MQDCNCHHCQQLKEVNEIAFHNYVSANRYRLFFNVIFYGMGVILFVLLFVVLFSSGKKQANDISDEQG